MVVPLLYNAKKGRPMVALLHCHNEKLSVIAPARSFAAQPCLSFLSVAKNLGGGLLEDDGAGITTS